MTFFHFFYFMVTGREIHLLFLSKISICFNDSVTCKNNKAGMGSSKSYTDFIDCYDLIFLYANGRIAIPAAEGYFPLFTTTTHRLVMFPLFTVMRTLPAFFALITPFLETVAIFLLDDLNEMLSVLPALTFTFKR